MNKFCWKSSTVSNQNVYLDANLYTRQYNSLCNKIEKKAGQ